MTATAVAATAATTGSALDDHRKELQYVGLPTASLLEDTDELLRPPLLRRDEGPHR